MAGYGVRGAAWCAVVLAAAGLASGQQTYSVAPPSAGGADSNAGSEDAPWATLQHAADRVNAGDTVIVRPGTYAGFNVGTSGTAAAPITFRAEPGVLVDSEAARFNGQTHRARINMDSVSWVVIEGFEVTGSYDHRVSRAGIRAVAPPGFAGGHIVIRDCHVHHNGQWGVFTGHVNAVTVEGCHIHDQAAEHGIYLSNSADDHVVRGNVVRSNSSNGLHVNSDASEGGDGVTRNVLVEGNTFSDNGRGSTYTDASGVLRTVPGGGSAVNFDGVRDSRIANNLLYANHTSGVSLYRVDGLLGAGNNVVVNNTIVQAADGRWCVNISDGSTGNVVFNNILLNYHGFRGSLIVTADSRPGLVSDHNVMMDRVDAGTGSVLNLAGWRALSGNDVHSIAVPSGTWGTLFADLAAGDYRLTGTSLAIDAGAAAVAGRWAPRDDLDGGARPSGGGFDIGAYEWAAPCRADFDGSGGAPDVADVFSFLAAWFTGEGADFDGSGGRPEVADIFAFLGAWFVGC